ncbi:MG2 domain-containing protein [Chitinophaga niabensis]|uniref:MG2 domain-containing protein n=1 Tax=Chitinophaga niabensis TaxID=536979 RepID=A0A1N6D977_9BACT|nr:MG2 domain-containing protein [Chitinophaga niabensis]SIN67339.1 MG2 domain-containing protein [Chitinophaga niabensis]
MQRKSLHKLRYLLMSCVLATGIWGAFGFTPPDDWATRIQRALANFTGNYPQEKVYLQLDKDYYASGETVWFSGFVTLNDLPATGARNLYAELRDQKGAIVQKELVLVYDGAASGEFTLPENMKPGLYQVRAYTAWMLNFDSTFLFYKNIQVFDPKTGKSGEETASKDYAVQFFPEGGDLVNEVSSVVAFKAIDQNGYPIKVAGAVRDANDKQVAVITTVHDGMGTFELKPEAGKTYKAVVQSASGQQKTFPLPVAKTSGIALKVYNRGSRIFYLTGFNGIDSTANNLLLVATMQNQLIYKAELNIDEGKVSGLIPTNNLPPGILQLTIFDNQGRPLSERLVYVNQKQDLLEFFLDPQELNKGPRQRTELVLQIPDSMRGHLSVAVTDADQVARDENANNIVTHTFLTSDIHGYVHNPYWYFQNDSTMQTLDLVMLTNGWRRYNWQQILQDKFPKITYPYEQGINITGTAYTSGRAPVTDGSVNFLIKIPVDSSSAFASAPVNSKGQFALSNLMYRDTAQIYFQGNMTNKKWKDVDVQFDRHFFDNFAPVKTPIPLLPPPPMDNKVLKNYLATVLEGNSVIRSMTNRTIFLKEVNINAKKPTPEETTEKRYASGMFAGGDGYTFDLTNENPTSFNVFQYLQARVPGLQIGGDMNNPSLSWRGGAPGVFLDQMPVDINTVANIPMSDVALIKVFRPPFMGGFGGGNGAIAIWTRRGGDSRPDPNAKGLELVKKGGYKIIKEFYSPDYSVKKAVHQLADKRLTLYWNAGLPYDTTNHTARIIFYNNDFTKNFHVVVEAMDQYGRVGRVVKDF